MARTPVKITDSSTRTVKVRNTTPDSTDLGLVVRTVGGGGAGSTAVSVTNTTSARVPVRASQDGAPWTISGSVTQGTSPWIVTSTSMLVKNTTAARVPTRATQDGAPWSFTSTSVKVSNTVAVTSTSAKVVNGAGAAAVNIQDGGNSVTVDGTVTANAGSGPWPVTDNSGSLTVDAVSLPLPTGAATETTLGLLPARSNLFKSRSDTFTGAANGTTVDCSAMALQSYGIQVKGTGAAASLWSIVLEGSLDNANFTTVITHANTDGDGVIKWSGANRSPCLYFRSRCVSITLGSATNVVVTIVGDD